MPPKQKPVQKDRSITLGGKKLTIVWGFRACLALQDKWGLATDEELFERIKNPKQKMSDFVDILWAALRVHHPEMSVEDVLDTLDKAGVEGVAEAVQQAIAASMPPGDAKKKPQTAPPQSR